jgi:DNA helicase HerA-like ATPase
MKNTIVFITGRKGSGKSTYAQKLASRIYAAGRRVVMLDPMNCFDLPGSPRIHFRREIVERLWGRSFVAIPGNEPQFPETVFRWAYICGDLTLVIDEVDIYLPHAEPSLALLDIIRYGRHRRINLIAVSQRPANVKRDLTAQADYLVMFQSTEPRDLDYLAARIGSQYRDSVAALPDFTPAVYSAQAGGLTEQEVIIY